MRIESHIDTAIIGAGPGGLMAGKTLGELNAGKTLVIEQGRRKRPPCPVLVHQKDCRGCGGQCSIINGAGGACSNVSCGLLSKYPAGSGLTNFLGVPEIQKKEEQIIEWLEKIYGRKLSLVEPNIPEETEIRLGSKGIKSKNYPSYEVLGKEFSVLIEQMVKTVHGMSNVDVRFSTRVVDVERRKSGLYTVTLSTGEKLTANNVIFAAGRAGSFDAVDIWSQIGMDDPKIKGYVGLRVEGPSTEALSELRRVVADPKFIRDGIRIFCFCPSGKVVGMRNAPTRGDFAGSVWDTLEGCVDESSPYGNFSIQQGVRFTADEYGNFLKELIVKQQEGARGNIIGQSLRSLEDGGRAEPFSSSVSSRIRTGSINDILSPDLVYRALNFLYDLDDVFNQGIITSATGVLAPEIHLWPELDLGPGFESKKIRGLYVVGDVSGVARGIMQAGIMGMAAAEHIAGS